MQRDVQDQIEGSVNHGPEAVSSAAPLLLSPEQAGELLNLAPSTVRFYCQSGQLPAARIGKHWRIPFAALTAHVAQGLAAGAAR